MEEKARGNESEKGNIVVKREKERDNEKKERQDGREAARKNAKVGSSN